MNIFHHTQTLPASFMHVHTEWLEITYCVCGSYQFFYELPKTRVIKERLITPGTLIIMPQNIPHGLRNVKYPYERYFIEISHEELYIIQGATNTLKTLIQAAEPFFWDLSENTSFFEKKLAAMYSAFNDMNLSQSWQNMHLLHSCGLFFCEIKKIYPNYFRHSAYVYTSHILQAKNYIDRHFREPITVEEVAEKLFLSQNYLSKLFKEQIGISPRQYLTQLRLSMAYSDLLSTSLTIQEVAERNGFRDVNYFIQTFKRTYHVTPKQYQKQLLENQPWA